MNNPASTARIIKETAGDLDFMFCGIAKAGFLEEEAPRLEKWLNMGFHGEMKYMENHFDLRLDPTKLVPGAKSVISLAYNYFPPQELPEDQPKLARYAYGRDYHKVIKKKLTEMVRSLQEKIGNFEYRIFTDSAPVMERQWAAKAGLGWIGKNTLLLSRQTGSWFFLCEIICDIEAEPDGQVKDYCGTCTACIDACPTDAIHPEGFLNASRCISYLTIELKNAIPVEFREQMSDWVFGCDICQEVCPWNRFARPHSEPQFLPREQLTNMSRKVWFEMTEDVFNELFEGSAVKRTGFPGLRRNLSVLSVTKD